MGARYHSLAKSAKAAGMSVSDVRQALSSAPAAFSHELAEAWQVCDSILRQIAETHGAASRAQVYRTHIRFASREQAKAFRKLQKGEIIDWLKQNKFDEQVADLYYKVVIAAVVEDFIEFAAKALECAVYGPLTVGIALLRKPLKDNLFALEWMLADPEDYFRRFTSAKPEERELRNLTPAHKTEIIRKAAAATAVGEWFPAELLYEFRFDKSSPIGLEALWQKANHLVTTQGVLATESENLNFVFSTEDDQAEQWRAVYGTLPIFFFHALQVYNALLSHFARSSDADKDLMPLRTIAGMALWMRSKGSILNLQTLSKVFYETVQRFIRATVCPVCGHRVSSRIANVRRFFEEGCVQCFPCHDVIVINESTDCPSPPI